MPPTRLPEEQIRHIEQTVMAYIDNNLSISNTALRALTGIKYDQATYFFNRMLHEGKLLRTGRTSGIRYIRPENATPTVCLDATSLVVCSYGCDDGRIGPTRCAVIGAGRGDR